jgi:hypothetical protein
MVYVRYPSWLVAPHPHVVHGAPLATLASNRIAKNRDRRKEHGVPAHIAAIKIKSMATGKWVPHATENPRCRALRFAGTALPTAGPLPAATK